ncbi:ABC transporter ATP-binding protein [Williamsoniiplasma somnilux]|uniref:ABC transporter ATP-binding protein n=1 Tax=Williamsoniiplasma somnilux TaxID=215578 RepID=A0A2K8NXJ1_9MOLU|nr:ABC transporter ATP-binding protein [Williamsoniiplasma somnilux]ATZ18507.1 ABC transporter ATP-binding protein [Williamsoniiplasma somnilux]
MFKKNKETKKVPKALGKTIFYYYLKEWKLSTVMLILVLITVGCSIMLPLLTEQMTIAVKKSLAENANQSFLTPNNFWGLTWDKLVYIAIGIIATYCSVSYFYDYFAYLIGRRIEIDLRNRSLESLVRQDISYYSDKKIGEILTKVVSDTQIVGDQAVQIPLQLGISFFEITASIVMMLVLAWQLALIVIVVFFMIIVAMALSFLTTRKRFNKVREVITDINGNVTDRISTVRLIKSSGTENYETERFKEVHKEYYKRSETVGRIQALMLTTMWGGVFILQFSSIIGAMVIFGSNPDPLVGINYFDFTFAAFNLAQAIMIGPIYQIMNATFGMAQASVAASRVDESIEAPSILNPHYFDGMLIDKINGDIRFENIEFAYPEKPEKIVLPEFDFTFKEGKSYAFVGETGSGKSTIAKLLLRFYDPTKGKIIINDGIDLQEVNLASYLNHVGYVEQDPQILFGDVLENVRYGSFKTSDEEVIEACKKAELHNLVMTWPDAYKTILGERGFMLSGGQKQRLVIARMFLKDPKLLILDEATSALDNIVEKEIQEKLESLMIGRTTISIAHRLSTIQNVDEIIVLGANGKGIVQRGTFEELKKMPGHFKKLYEAGLMD